MITGRTLNSGLMDPLSSLSELKQVPEESWGIRPTAQNPPQLESAVAQPILEL
jgi:hypothetical protein